MKTEKPLTLGSLFDGSGGFPLGGLLAGITPVWASEIEPFPIRVTTKRLPFMKHYGNISAMDGGRIEPVDIITFGSPCQDMSVAGSDENLQRIMCLKASIQKNNDRKCKLKKLRVKSIIDAVMYNQELNRMEKQNEEARRKIQSLGNIESGLMLWETEKLLHFIEAAKMLDTYDEKLFTSFVDSIIVYSRDSVGFKLKCGLTLREELCTDTKS